MGIYVVKLSSGNPPRVLLYFVFSLYHVVGCPRSSMVSKHQVYGWLVIGRLWWCKWKQGGERVGVHFLAALRFGAI